MAPISEQGLSRDGRALCEALLTYSEGLAPGTSEWPEDDEDEACV
jgi:hypothetical protein